MGHNEPKKDLLPFSAEYGSFGETIYNTRYGTEYPGVLSSDAYPMPHSIQPDAPDWAGSHNAPAITRTVGDPYAGKG